MGNTTCVYTEVLQQLWLITQLGLINIIPCYSCYAPVWASYYRLVSLFQIGFLHRTRMETEAKANNRLLFFWEMAAPWDCVISFFYCKNVRRYDEKKAKSLNGGMNDAWSAEQKSKEPISDPYDRMPRETTCGLFLRTKHWFSLLG